jgi:hypothetical protein
MKRLDDSKIRLVLVVFVAAIVLGGSGSASADFTFGEPVNLGPPINSSSREFTVAISADNLEMYVSSERPGGVGYFDIYRRTRENEDDPWGPLVNVQEINSRYNEAYPCLAADGLTLYFSDWYNWNPAGNRPGGIGDHDLWMSTRLSTDDPWGQPVNMGAVVNSVYAEVSPCVSQDGQTLIFASKRPGGFGDYDLWMSTRPTADSDWTEPVNMGPAVNTSAYDGEPWLSHDGLVLFFSSECPPGRTNSSDLWVTTRRSRDAAWSPAVNLGPAINTSYPDGSPSLSPDLKTLYFNSDQPSGMGGWDMYEVPIIPILDFNGDGIVEIGDLLFLIESWGQGDSTTDIGPAPWGDGIVDVRDLEVLMSYWGQEVEDPTLVAHWKLDEAEGSIAEDSAGDNNGIVFGDAVWQPDGGMIKGALQFDGIDDYVSTPFVLNPADGKFSVSAWIKGGAAGQVVLSQTGGANWLSADPSEGNFTTELVPPTTRSPLPPLVSETQVTDGNWHHIGFVWNGAYRTLYVDGVIVAEDIQSNLASSSNGLYIGTGKNLDAGTFFSGLIDDIRIYNKALSQAQITAVAQ